MSECPIYTYDWATTRLYELEHLWWGVSVGGSHYTGTVNWHPPGTRDYLRHELERKLSLRDAKALDPDNGTRRWRLGGHFRVSNRFDTLDHLERVAVAWVKEHAAGVPNILLLERSGGCNPVRAIWGSGWFEDRVPVMTQLAAMWDKVPDGMRLKDGSKPTPVWKATYRAWYALLTPPGAKPVRKCSV